MEIKASSSSNRITSLIVISLVIFIAINLIANIVLSIQIYKLSTTNKTVIVPMTFNSPIAVSDQSGDASYLRYMALSFIYLRLSVTPESVEKSHDTLLSFIIPESRPEMQQVLADERIKLKLNNVTSTFYTDEIKVFSTKNIVEVRGKLRVWFGERFGYEENKTYLLKFQFKNGTISVDKFLSIENKEKNSIVKPDLDPEELLLNKIEEKRK